MGEHFLLQAALSLAMCRRDWSEKTMYYHHMQDSKKNPELLRSLPTCVAQQDAFVEVLPANLEASRNCQWIKKDQSIDGVHSYHCVHRLNQSGRGCDYS